jgi:hypoxanthine phosphoribosyltransferase
MMMMSSPASTEALTPEKVGAHLDLYLTAEQIAIRTKVIADQINRDYADCKELTVLCVLKGSFMWTSDLAKYLNIPCQIEFIRLASYGDGMHTSGSVKPVNLTLPNLADKDVLIVEDIIDSGLTLNFLLNYLRDLHHTKSTKLAVLLDKYECRREEAKSIHCDYVGFPIENHFVVGYGLDFAGQFRNLPEIYRYTG